MTPEYRSATGVWATSLNEGNWPTQGLSYCVGFLGNVATFVGADASVHLAEEVSNAARNIPKAIIGAMLINGAVGFVMMVRLAVTWVFRRALILIFDVDHDSLLPRRHRQRAQYRYIHFLLCLPSTNKPADLQLPAHPDTGFPFIQIFANSVPSRAGATIMAAIVLLLTWACATGITTTASRMTWSFARDNGLPASKYLAKVDPRTKVPVVACLVVTSIAALLTLIYIGSEVAFNDVISLTITGFYGSYLLPASLLLYRRVKGHILPHDTSAMSSGGLEPVMTAQAGKTVDLNDNAAAPNPEAKAGDVEKDSSEHEPDLTHGTILPQQELIWGPFHLPHTLGILNNAYAVLYMTFVIFFSVWPPATPVSASTMNYSVVVTGGVAILSAVWYFVRARKVYRGPTVDKEVEGKVRKGSVGSVVREGV